MPLSAVPTASQPPAAALKHCIGVVITSHHASGDHAMSDAKKQLKIKTGSVKRLSKEVVMYRKDEQTESDRVARMKATGSDASDIKHAVSYRL